MPSSPVDLDAYCERVGYSHSRSPTLDTLRQLQLAHAETIAFENLSPFLGERVEIDLIPLQEKLVRRGRGGYCYEQNSLLWYVLGEMGFDVSGLAARVLWNIPDGIVVARTHMLLLVNLDGNKYIVDVGFGGMIPTGPLRLGADVEQETPHEPFRLICREGQYTLHGKVAGDWRALYSFDLQEQFMPDYAVCNWYHSTYPDSPFVKDLVAARVGSGCRHALTNNNYTVYHLSGRTESRLLTSTDDLMEILRTVFRLRLPRDPDYANELTKRLSTGTRDDIWRS